MLPNGLSFLDLSMAAQTIPARPIEAASRNWSRKSCVSFLPDHSVCVNPANQSAITPEVLLPVIHTRKRQRSAFDASHFMRKKCMDSATLPSSSVPEHMPDMGPVPRAALVSIVIASLQAPSHPLAALCAISSPATPISPTVVDKRNKEKLLKGKIVLEFTRAPSMHSCFTQALRV